MESIVEVIVPRNLDLIFNNVKNVFKTNDLDLKLMEWELDGNPEFSTQKVVQFTFIGFMGFYEFEEFINSDINNKIKA